MPPPPMVPISGEKLRKMREDKLSLTRASLAQKTGKSQESIRRYEKPGVNAVPGEWVSSLADLAGEQFGILRLKLLPEIGDIASPEDADALKAAGQTADPDPNVVPGEEVWISPVPFFELQLAAGGWEEVPESVVVCDKRTREQGLFRVCLRGDSMEPRYDDRSIIEFRCLFPPTVGLQVGRDYYVQRCDGTATFKRLTSIRRNDLVFTPLNVAKFPEPLVVPIADVVRMAVAVARVEIL